MGVENAMNVFRGLIENVGKASVHALFPDEFELYLMALELTDSNGNLIDYLAFPVMPESISISKSSRTTVNKTNRGTTVLSSPSYMPAEISIRGNFGRQFQLILSPKEPTVKGVAFSFRSGKKDLFDLNDQSLTLKTKPFGAGVKTGYGVIKVLQAILEKSNGVDGEGKPFRLYLYNLALGESYLVVLSPNGFSVSQDLSKNMIWNYNVSFTILAPLGAIKANENKTSYLQLLRRDAIQKTVYSTIKSINGMI